ncbi:MAG: hypothetical protein KBS44_01210, partial [Clostridiales bacterium]|nr:hypothetical protein [Candidatus Coliplasma equi]
CIYDANGNYLSASATPAVTNAYSDEDATPWIVASNGSSVTIAAVINGTKYYLGNNNGTLTLTTTPTNWVKNGNSYYTTVGDIDYYLTYSDGAWRTIPLAYQIITDNNGHYLRVTGNNAFANGTQANATHFYFENPGENPSGKAYCIVNGTTYYLRNTVTNNNGALRTDTNAANAASWVNNGSSLTVDSADGNYTYALRYNNGWTIQTFKNGKYITDGKGNYLQLTGTGTTNFTNTTNVANATVFTFDADGRIHATVNNTEVYLRNNNGTFVLRTQNNNRTQWTIGSDSIGNDGNYIVCDGGTWKLSTSTIKPAYRISYTTGGTTYYMGANGTTLTAVTDINDALLFDSTSGSIATEINGNTYYLNMSTANPPVFSLSGTASNFTNNDNCLYITTRGTGFDFLTTYYHSILFDTSNRTWGATRTTSADSGTQLTFAQVTSEQKIMETYGENASHNFPTVVVNDVLLPTPVVYSDVTEREVPEIYVEEDPIEASLTWSDGELLVVEKTAGPNSYTGTYFPLRTELHDVEEGETYSGSNPYGVSPENTGYIIGGNYETSDRHADILVSQYSTSDITNSYRNG